MNSAPKEQDFGQPPRNKFKCVAFSRESFFDEVKAACCPPDGSWVPTAQAEYLAAYLSQLGVESLVIESYYIDRHYMEEVSLYYSRCLVPRRNWTTRIHAFAGTMDDARIDAVLAATVEKENNSALDSLQNDYRGYIVVRPLPSVPIGRTVLRHLVDNNARKFLTCYSYPVHFLGLKLSVEGLAFQQQDRAVAACATTAIWSALQRVCRRDGARPPTSWEITDAAVRHYLPEGRAYPSPGLTIEQMCDALRSFEFAPDVLRYSGLPDYYLILLHIYLRSGIPVILMFQTPDAGHAVTVVGYREAGSVVPTITLGEGEDEMQLTVMNLGYDGIFIHDDRLGPYAKASLKPGASIPDTDGLTNLDISIDWPDGTTETSSVRLAAVPLYPKLRTNAKELFETAVTLLPLLHTALMEVGKSVGLEIFLTRSGEYQSDLFRHDVDPQQIATFQRTIALSRYIGVHRWYIDDTPALDVLWDTTDTLRETRHKENLLGVVSLSEDTREIARKFADHFGIVLG